MLSIDGKIGRLSVKQRVRRFKSYLGLQPKVYIDRKEAMSASNEICPRCNGNGEWLDYTPHFTEASMPPVIACAFCRGTGEVTEEEAMDYDPCRDYEGEADEAARDAYWDRKIMERLGK